MNVGDHSGTRGFVLDILRHGRGDHPTLQALDFFLALNWTAELDQFSNEHLKENSRREQLQNLEELGPLTLQRENARRRVEGTARTVLTYLSASLKDLRRRASGNATLLNTVNGIQKTLLGMQNTLVADIHYLRRADSDEEWRKSESRRLGKLVQNRLDFLQNPTDCSQRRFVVCNLRQACGFGCLLHHACYCLLVAYATNRTFLLQEGEGGLLFGQHKWSSVFKPLSKTCKTYPVPTLLDHKVAMMKKLEFKKPIVGIHIRRTDKVQKVEDRRPEAKYHSLEEYMGHIDTYFREREHRWNIGKRKVYLATDDPTLLDEARKKYPTYMFVSDNNVSMLASAKSRYSNTSLLGIIMDISFLSMSDFLVCTFSSNVCRAAYELMQANEGDASSYAVSLDKRFYFNGQRDERMWTVEKHKAENRHQLSFESGDLLQIIGNDLSGMVSRALNLRTGKEGMFPTYKAVKEIVAVKMPTYPEVGEPNEA
ncbi:hypothetical protein BaRGS_00031152 [Batillaria attramentaria]|uniref:GT23 domain-containing protein n=1 Tax=Batillaria attramentaria TaxID=370345 RepID=A0ABD0JRI2_9CAEN